MRSDGNAKVLFKEGRTRRSHFRSVSKQRRSAFPELAQRTQTPALHRSPAESTAPVGSEGLDFQRRTQSLGRIEKFSVAASGR